MFYENKLIEKCIAGDKKAQKRLYTKYAPRFWGVCLRYAKNQAAAEDLLQEGFIKVFTNLKQYNGNGSFEGWMRKTMVNTAINQYKKDLLKKKEEQYNEDISTGNYIEPSAIDKLTIGELVALVQHIPERYRIVFNLYVFEGFFHREIAEELNISVKTSRSYLLRGRQIMKGLVEKKLNCKENINRKKNK